jgi:Tol biopolymer transport system component
MTRPPAERAGWGRPIAAVLLLAGCGSAPSPPAAAEDLEAAAIVYEHTIDGNKDVYILPATGGEPRRLTTEASDDGLPRFTPNGRAVVYTSDRAGNWQIFEIPVEGGRPERVRSNPHTEWQADVSPDGDTLAFLSDRDGTEGLWLMNLQTKEPRALVRQENQPIMGNPDWSPDGRRIVFSSNWHRGHQIYVVEAESGAVERISPLASGGCEPRFSPDGKKVVYVSRPSSTRSRLVEHDLGTHAERVLVDWPALNYDPAYSPDGRELAFASNISGEWVLYRQRLSDGRAYRLTFRKGDARYPDYRP